MSVIVNGKEYPDERSVPEKYRMYSQEATRLRDPGNFSADLPPNVGRSILPHVTTFSGMMSTLARTYRQHDEAIRHNKHNANMMRRDPMIMGPLFARQMAVALLQWQIQPEDSNDEKQVQIAKELSFMVCRIPRFREYLRNLMEAVWYGRYGIQNVWGFARDSRGVRYRTVVDWVPVNGDKLLFRYDDGTGRYDHNQIGIKVSVAHIKNDIWAGKPDIEWNSEGTGVFLRRWERSRLVIHKNFMMDGDYEDPTTAGMIHGVGLRHFLYWSWYQKQETLAQLAEVVERAGMGFTVYNYPAGNAQAKEEVERLAEEQAHKNQIVLPMEVSNPDAYGIQQIPPNTQGIMALQSLIDDYFGSWIIKFILGQTLSYRAEAGTPGISDLHRDSFLQIVKYDSLGVEETVTKELIRMLLLFNFPSYQNVNFQFKLNTEEAVPLEKLQALQAAWSMGAKIKSKDVMGLIGLNVAGDTDQALYNPQVLASLKEYEMMEEQQEQEEQGDQVSQMSESQDEALAAMLGPIMQAKKYDKKESDMPSIKEDLHELLLKPHESQNSHQRVVDHLSAMGMEADAKNLESSKFKDDYASHVKDLIERLFGSEEERESEEYAKKEKSGNYKPNQGMKGNAKRGLELRKKHGKGGTSVGVARARDIMNGKGLSFSTVKRMHSFFSRHAGNEEGGEDDAGYIAWLLWGGDSGRNWSRSIVESERKNQVPLSALTDDVESAVDPGVEANPNPGVVEPPKTETAQAEVVEKVTPLIIDTPRQGRDDKSVTGSILSGVLEGASGGLKRRVMGQPQAQYDKEEAGSFDATQEDFEDPEVEILEVNELKTPEEYVDTAHDHFGQTDDVMLSSFIHPDGSMSSRQEGDFDLSSQAEHIRSISKVFEDYTPDTIKGKDRGLRSVRHFQRFGSFPVLHNSDDESSYIELRSDLTEQQYDLIKRMLEEGRSVHVSILDKTRDDETWRATLRDPDEIENFKEQVKARTIEKGVPFDFDVDDFLVGSPHSAVPVLRDSRVLVPNSRYPGRKPATRDAYLYMQKVGGQYNQPLKEDTEENNKAIEDAIFDEGMFALSRDTDAIGWYEKTFKKAQQAYFEAFPELESDRGKRAVFNAIMAFTSNGAKVEDNHRVAFDLYNQYRDSGSQTINSDYKFAGKEVEAMKTHAIVVNELVERLGSTEAFADFMSSKFTMSSLKEKLRELDMPQLGEGLGELKGMEFRGANILGPKLGSFYNNLNQIHDTLTMDRWFTRTYKRIMGTVTDVNQGALESQLDRLELRFKKHNATDDKGNPIEPAQYAGRGTYVTQDNERLSYASIRKGIKELRSGGRVDEDNPAVKYVVDRQRIFKRADPVTKRTFQDKTEENYASLRVFNNLYELADAPESGSERKRIRTIMEKVRTRMSDAGFDMSISDLQALLWYHEKRLLPHVGIVDDRQLPDDYARQARVEVDRYLGRIKDEKVGDGTAQRVQSDGPRFGVSTKNSRRQSEVGGETNNGEEGNGESGRSEETLSNEEAFGQIASAIQDAVRSALNDKMQPERNAMGAGPRDHSPEDFDVTNKQINGQATANRGTMPKQATQSSMPSKADKGSVSTNPVSKTGMSSDATRMDRGASLDDMRDKFMKYRKTKLIEMLQPFVQEDPNFSLTDAQGKKRRTSLFKADKYSLAYSLAERYAEAQDPFSRTPAVNKNINNIISDYTEGKLSPGMKDHAEVADKLHEAWSETHGEHLGHVADFNSNFDRFRTALGFKSTSGFNNALRKAEDVDQIKGFDELEKGASEDLLNSAKNLGIELGEGDPNQQLLQALKSGKQKRLGKLSSDNWIKAVERLKAAGMDLANYAPEEVEGVASEISDQAGSGKQLEFDPDPDEVNFELDRSRQRDEDRGRQASEPGSQQFLGLESEPSVTQIESGEGDPNQQLLQATQTADEGGKPSVDSVPDDYSDIPFEGFQSELGDTNLSPSQVNELLSQGNPDQPLTEEEEELADKQREREEALRRRGELAASQVSQSISERQKAQDKKTQELRERGQSAIAGVEQSMGGRAAAEERERQLIEGTPEEIAAQKDIAAQQDLLGVSSQEDMANQIKQVIQNDMEQIGKRIDAEAERWKTNIKMENERIGKIVEEENRIKQFFSQSEDPIRQYHQMAIPHVDSDIKIKVNINSRKDPSQEPIQGDISFASDGKGDYFMKLVNAEGEEYLYTSKRAEKVLGDQFNRLVGEVIKKDNKRWSERLDIAGLVAPQKTIARGLAKGDQIYLTREEKTVIDSHVVNAMRGLGPGAGGIDFADYSNFDDAAEASYEQMRGHIEDIQKPGGWFEHMESIGFKMNTNASVAENYLNGIQHAMDTAAKTGFKGNRELNAVENMQGAFEHLAEQTGNLSTWGWVAGGVGVLAFLALFYSLFRD